MGRGKLRRKLTLKIDTQLLEDHQAKLTVEIEPELLENAKRRAARKLANRVKIPGFRPGKAPYNVVERYVGQATILEDALEILVDDMYPKVIEESGIKPYGPGKLENMPTMEPPTFEFLVPLESEVTLGDYRSIRLPYEPQAITEKEVDKFIDDLRTQRAVIEPVERPAQEGDQVYIRLSGERVQVAEAETTTLIKERQQLINIEKEDADNKDEWPFPGFSRHLIGLAPGDEKTIGYTYPDDSTYEALRGKIAEFHIVIEQVKSRNMPELNDAFAQSVGEYATVDALRVDVRKSLEARAKTEYDAEYSDKINVELLKDATLKYAPQMLEREVEGFISDLKNRLAQQNLDMDTYLKMRKMDLDALRKDILPNAENRLKHSLVLLEVAKSEGIKIEQNELESRTLRTLEELSQSLPMKEIKKINTNDFVAGLAGNIASNMMVEQTLERLRAYARGEVIEKVENPTTEPTLELEVEKDVNVSIDTTADERTENTQEAAQLGSQSTVPDSTNEEHG